MPKVLKPAFTARDRARFDPPTQARGASLGACRALGYDQARGALSPRAMQRPTSGMNVHSVASEPRKLSLNQQQGLRRYSERIDTEQTPGGQEELLRALAEDTVQQVGTDAYAFIRQVDGLLYAAAQHGPQALELFSEMMWNAFRAEEAVELRHAVLQQREGWMMLSRMAVTLMCLDGDRSAEAAAAFAPMGGMLSSADPLRTLGENWQGLRSQYQRPQTAPGRSQPTPGREVPPPLPADALISDSPRA